MSLSGSNPWSTFLSELPIISPDAEAITSEELFHRRFMTYCESRQEKDPQRLLNRFLRHHDEIIRFVGTLDESMKLEPTESLSLSSKFWSRAFEVVVMALNTKQKLVLVRQYLPELDGLIPTFGPELALFADQEIVRRPLQSIFAAYMSCYATILQLLDPKQEDVNMETFTEQTRDSKQSIAALKDEWAEQVKKAAFEAAAAGATPDRYHDPFASVYQLTSGPDDQLKTHVAFEWIGSLGKGTYGEVAKVREVSSGAIYAQKTMTADPRMRRSIRAEFLNEVSIMQRLRHQHIASVQLYVLETDKYSMFMLPAADYDLRRYLRQCADHKFPATDLAQLTTWFGCLISALTFAHAKDIKHEDIKPNNILIKDNVPYLTDFGCAKDFSGLENSTSLNSATTGTPVYWPPEEQPRGRRADVWSLGCVFSEMLSVRQKKTIDDFQQYRFMPLKDNGYSFRESLDKVRGWLEEIVPSRDNIGQLLKEQTLNMLEPTVTRRKEARDIKRGLKLEAESTFCSSCL